MEKMDFKVSSNEQFVPATIHSESEKKERSKKIFLGKTKDDALVYNRVDSHFHEEGGLTSELLRTALSVIDTDGRSFLKQEIDFDKPIGLQTCVEVKPEDEVVMVYRKGRSGQTPMVKNRNGEPCNSLTVVLREDRSMDNSYELVTSYIGKGSVREPWDPNLNSEEERRQCEDFWNSHALVYDDNLIDWGKTKEYEFMSESDKKAELIRARTLYAGFFIDPEELYQKISPTLEKTIESPHVTTNFKPTLGQLHLNQLGNSVKIEAIGYGNDGKNEGLLVKVKSDDSTTQEMGNMIKTPHITLSISRNGQAKNTAFLDFTPLEKPFEINGRYGIFMQGAIITDMDDLLSDATTE